ncbi:Hypothetical Protein FCC1311_022312 [Hondaea fermentalgiana]|uniref:Uncharacterized protein n=1 Tax=Hondaea fermentalgiana TaxID=2315210 RepID=A0A2R5GCW3_9STRA|nr:Hypothetical Protein FCC1311_022312 [Hondaea fermentalgiana]|eukprot:GBG26011.1 Hypothetical Protein FCC1311_022312 [Hondaea fermentalgiana]
MRRARADSAGERRGLLGGPHGGEQDPVNSTVRTSSRTKLCSWLLAPVVILVLFLGLAPTSRLQGQSHDVDTLAKDTPVATTRATSVPSNARQPAAQVSSAWSHEEAYAEVQLQNLGNALLKAVNASYESSPEPSCDDCDPTPFYINPKCAQVCRAANSSQATARHCWQCRHWAVNLASELGAPAPRFAKTILHLPVLTRVTSMATDVLAGRANALTQRYDEHNSDFALQGQAVVAAVAERLANMHAALDSVNSTGSGGGMGLQVYCNGSLLLSMGGGGGNGFSSETPSPKTADSLPATSFGGGEGAGFQIYDNNSNKSSSDVPPKPTVSFGGGAGGGLRLERGANSTHVASSAGSSPDATNKIVPQEELDRLRDQMRQCWAQGNLTVVGGGGLGGGAQGDTFSAHGDIAFRFKAFQKPCPGCDGQPYQTCMCPCFRSAYLDGAELFFINRSAPLPGTPLSPTATIMATGPEDPEPAQQNVLGSDPRVETVGAEDADKTASSRNLQSAPSWLGRKRPAQTKPLQQTLQDPEQGRQQEQSAAETSSADHAPQISAEDGDNDKTSARATHQNSWMTSGELLYRANFQGSPFADEWRKTFADASFQEFLSDGLAAVDATRRHDTAEQDLVTVQDSIKRLHEQRVRKFATRRRGTESTIDAALERLEIDRQDASAQDQDTLAHFDRTLLSLCALYAANIEKECALLSSDAATADREHRKLRAEREHAFALEEFGLHLAHETEGRINLRRLTPDNPQYSRCKRATAENVKSDFFGKDANYSGIKVLDVFKIENRPLLRDFQRRAAALKPGSVKGLFCAVPEESLFRIIVEGMGRKTQDAEDTDEAAAQQDSSAPSSAAAAATFLRTHLVALEPEAGSSPGYAEARFLASKPVAFPKQFSRFSTLEEFREAVKAPVMGTNTGSRDQHHGQASAVSSSSSSTSQTVPRYLALCRVIIGSSFVTSADYPGFPNVDSATSSKFDSIFSSSLDEYLVLHGHHVLPEFLIRYEYKPRFNPTSSQLQARVLAPLEPDFASPEAPDALQEVMQDFRTVAARTQPSLVPHAVALPSSRGPITDETTSAAQRAKASRFMRAAEIQAGRDTLRLNAARQRDEIWAALTQVLHESDHTDNSDTEINVDGLGVASPQRAGRRS